MTLNGVMAVILRYFTELVYDVVLKQFTSSIDIYSRNWEVGSIGVGAGLEKVHVCYIIS